MYTFTLNVIILSFTRNSKRWWKRWWIPNFRPILYLKPNLTISSQVNNLGEFYNEFNDDFGSQLIFRLKFLVDHSIKAIPNWFCLIFYLLNNERVSLHFQGRCQYKLSLTDRLEEKCIHNLPPVEKSFEEFIENSGNRIYFVKWLFLENIRVILYRVFCKFFHSFLSLFMFCKILNNWKGDCCYICSCENCFS